MWLVFPVGRAQRAATAYKDLSFVSLCEPLLFSRDTTFIHPLASWNFISVDAPDGILLSKYVRNQTVMKNTRIVLYLNLLRN